MRDRFLLVRSYKEEQVLQWVCQCVCFLFSLFIKCCMYICHCSVLKFYCLVLTPNSG
jgi:hypothetical protein